MCVNCCCCCQTEYSQERCQIFSARPVPDFSRKFEPQLSHKRTEPEPFAFEERYKDKPSRQTLVQQIRQKEKVCIELLSSVLPLVGPLIYYEYIHILMCCIYSHTSLF